MNAEEIRIWMQIGKESMEFYGTEVPPGVDNMDVLFAMARESIKAHGTAFPPGFVGAGSAGRKSVKASAAAKVARVTNLEPREKRPRIKSAVTPEEIETMESMRLGCTRCQASGLVKDLFGLRQTTPGSGKFVPQSWCKKCRATTLYRYKPRKYKKHAHANPYRR